MIGPAGYPVWLMPWVNADTCPSVGGQSPILPLLETVVQICDKDGRGRPDTLLN